MLSDSFCQPTHRPTIYVVFLRSFLSDQSPFNFAKNTLPKCKKVRKRTHKTVDGNKNVKKTFVTCAFCTGVCRLWIRRHGRRLQLNAETWVLRRVHSSSLLQDVWRHTAWRQRTCSLPVRQQSVLVSARRTGPLSVLSVAGQHYLLPDLRQLPHRTTRYEQCLVH